MRTAVDLATGSAIDQAAFAAACKLSGQVVSRVDLLQDGQFVARLDVSAGSVQFSRSAQMYARLSGLVVAASTLDLPTVSGGRLTPSGWEARVWAGLKLRAVAGSVLAVWLTDEDYEVITDESGVPISVGDYAVAGSGTDIDAVVPLITAPLESAQVDAFGFVAVDAWDRSEKVSADLLMTTLVWPGTFTTVEEAVDSLVRRTFPNITTSFAGATHACPTIAYERDASPWRIITDAATSAGCFARFDGMGNFVWSPEPDLSSAEPVVEFVEGGTLSDIRASVSNRGVHNGWTVVGTNPDTAGTDYVAIAYDDTVGSRTQWEGSYWRRPMPSVRMPEVATQAAADEAVLGLRAARLGFAVEIEAAVVPDYLVEPPDAVTFTRLAAGVDGVALLESQTVPLAPGSMSLSARARQVAS